MTLKYFCDRCDFIADDKHINFNINPYPRKGKGPYTQSIDLCSDCFILFQKFMKEYKKKFEKKK